MKIQIRKGVFETNSSSTHAINIFRGYNEKNIPESIVVRPGEFRQECDTYYDFKSKLSYLYIWCLNLMSKDEAEYKITQALNNLRVKEVEFEECSGWYEEGYIDHSEELYSEDLNTIFENYFGDFIFGDSLYIETGNDNSDIEVYEDGRADFSIYKGN